MSFASIRIAIKLPIVIIGLCFATAVAISTLAYVQSKATLLDQTHKRLNALATQRGAQLEMWAQTVSDDVRGFASDPSVVDAILALSNTFDLLGDNPTADLQDAYIANNPYDASERDLLDKSDVPHPYHFQHERYHHYFRNLKDTDQYYDVFLFNDEGDLIYSVYKEADFATNLISGPYENSGLGKAYQAAMSADPGPLVLVKLAKFVLLAMTGSRVLKRECDGTQHPGFELASRRANRKCGSLRCDD